MSDQNLTVLNDAELDAVAAAGRWAHLNYVGVFAAVQTNVSNQTSINVLSFGSGNQVAYQSNNASVG